MWTTLHTRRRRKRLRSERRKASGEKKQPLSTPSSTFAKPALPSTGARCASMVGPLTDTWHLSPRSQTHDLWEQVELEAYQYIEQKQWPDPGLPPRRQFQSRDSPPPTPKGLRDAINMAAPPLTPHSPTISSRQPLASPLRTPMSPLRTPSPPARTPHGTNTPQSSSRPMSSARPMPRTPLTTARSSAEARALRGGTPFATPRTPLSTTRVSELPWNRPPPEPEPEDAFTSMFKSITGWWGETFGDNKKKKPKKRKKLKPYDPSTDDRPPWESGTNRAPLTGPSGPSATAFHRTPRRPWESDGDVPESSRESRPSSDGHWQPMQLPEPEGLKSSEEPDGAARPRTRVTRSPSGRTHPSRERRGEIREAELMNSITYFDQARESAGSKLLGIPESANDQLGGYIGKDATRYMAGSGWIPSQAWGESLRYYPTREEAERVGDSWIALSGETHSISNVPESHLESDVRTRSGVAAADPEWQKDQLPITWAPRMIPNHLKKRLDQTVTQLLTARETSASSRGAHSERTKMSSRTTPPRQRREGRKRRGEWPCCASPLEVRL